jgi:2-desacetyl-2-hydroxyethyl bacteriochlorophyllide A dehydrogenase
MKALVMDRERRVRLTADWPEPPAPGPGEVRVRTRATGLSNGTERNWLVGGNYAPPETDLPCLHIGYQAVGVIEGIGPGGADLRVGQRVFCGDFVGHVARFVAGRLLLPLPPTISDPEAALFGIASVAVHATRRADIRIGERVLVVGLGPVGQLLAQMAAACGARVVGIDEIPDRVLLARELGACEAVELGRVDEHEPGGTIFDVVIDAAGVPTVEALIARCRRQGRILLIAGRFQVAYPFNPGQLREIAVLQSDHFEAGDLELLPALVMSGRVRIKPLIQDIVPIEQAEEIYARLRERPATLMGTVFIWSSEGGP